MTNHTIDTNTTPFLPHGLQGVAEHHHNGQLILDFTKIQLYEADWRVAVNKEQTERERSRLMDVMTTGVKGSDVLQQLKDAHKNFLNANVLDYLIKYQTLIPEIWKTNKDGVIQHVYFLGTIYKNPDAQNDNLCACYLYWNQTHWDWSYKYLYTQWDTGEVAAIV